MNRKYRKAIVAGNWKMNLLPSQVKPFGETLRELAATIRNTETAVCVPFVMLPAAVRVFRDSRIAVGAQNMSDSRSGAFTGEVSPDQLRDLGVKYVIIGHSERRSLYGENDLLVNRKLRLAMDSSLRPIVCVGETELQREMELTLDLIRLQVRAALYGLEAHSVRKVVFAYEPIWAIGTGNNASPLQAQEVSAFIRGVIRENFDACTARAVSILYGGSVKPSNSAELFAQPDIDGALVGGASLEPGSFYEIIRAAENAE